MRKTHIFYGNQHVESFNCDGKKYTKWQLFKHNTALLVKRIMIVMFTIGVLVGATYGGYQFGSVEKVDFVSAKEVDVSDTRFNAKIDVLKMQLVEQLMSCESPGYKDSDGLITFDPHRLDKTLKNAPSIGRLQFKVSTVQYYQKTLYNADLTATEAIKFALDTEKAKVLARDIIFKSSNKANDWLNCANKLDLNKRIDLIKSLEK